MRVQLVTDNQQMEASTPTSKKVLQLVLEEAEVIELMRILIDDDAAGALAFMRRYLKGKARELLEGG